MASSSRGFSLEHIEQLIREVQASRDAILAAEARLESATQLLEHQLRHLPPPGRPEPADPAPLEPEEDVMIGAMPTEEVLEVPAHVPTTLRRGMESEEEFLRLASHDMKEPVRGIQYFSQLLSDDFGELLGEEGRSHLEYIHSATRRLTRLMEDVQTLARLKRVPPEPVPVDPRATFQAVTDELSTLVALRRASFKISRRLPMVRVDASRLHELLRQLTRNALLYSDAPATIELCCDGHRESMATFRIKDKGMGIEPQFLEHIFGLFQRLHTWEAIEGTGAGLAIARRIVDQHGGRIWAESSLKHGSSFCFTLPLATDE